MGAGEWVLVLSSCRVLCVSWVSFLCWQGLVDLVSEHLSTIEAGPEADKVRGHLRQTLAHIERNKEGGDTRLASQFSQLSLPST